MKNFITIAVRLLILVAGIALAGFIFWQLLTDASMLDVDIQTMGPTILVIFSLLALITLATSISFFTNKNAGSTILLGAVLTIFALVLWYQNQDLADIYRWYFIYGLLAAVFSPFFKKKA